MLNVKQASIFIIILTILSLSCFKEQPPNSVSSQKTVGLKGIVHPSIPVDKISTPPCDQELSRKETAERMDKLDMLYTARVTVDRDDSMLKIPDSIKGKLGNNFTVAETPPEIEFAIIPVEPKFLSTYNDQKNTGWWGNYCQSNYHAPSKTFYSAVADHGSYDAHIYLFEYDSKNREIRCRLRSTDPSEEQKSSSPTASFTAGWTYTKATTCHALISGSLPTGQNFRNRINSITIRDTTADTF